MNFVSLQYILFLPVTVLLYYLLPKKIKNPVLLAVSYFFYICFGAKYAGFMIASTLTTYIAGILIARNALGKKKLWLVLTVILNIGLLFFLKYYNFASQTLTSAFRLAGADGALPMLNLLLPAGISFYTFMAVGYIVDVYKGKVPAEYNIIDYALFVSFFPQITSGPIERAGNILPQLKAERKFSIDKFRQGLTLLVWGFVKKMILADNLAVIIANAFGNPRGYTGAQLAFATLCFTLQIYCDFSACTDLARGSAKLVGIDLMKNFECPYIATSLKDFWRRWHISLSSWFRDYLYFPLGGSRVPKWRHCLNIVIVFLVSGLWHGAALTYVVWGLFHGLFQVFGILLTPVREKTVYRICGKDNKMLGFFKWLGTFFLVCVGWIFFRANSISDAFYIIKAIAKAPFGNILPLAFAGMGLGRMMLCVLFGFTVLLAAVDVAAQKKDVLGYICGKFYLRYIIYLLLVLAIFFVGYYGPGFEPQDFIYFKY